MADGPTAAAPAGGPTPAAAFAAKADSAVATGKVRATINRCCAAFISKMIPHYPQAGGEPVVHGAPEPADKGMEKDEADKAAQDGAGGSDDDDISRKLSFSTACNDSASV